MEISVSWAGFCNAQTHVLGRPNRVRGPRYLPPITASLNPCCPYKSFSSPPVSLLRTPLFTFASPQPSGAPAVHISSL
ncbi:hypothetical protein BD310DRAFT_564230 [Dichomitus squalens]|uniref:Uncharacterized protein n=1 Tax=Dichomitus squalens TaxID=114155 RepID=A0A4Q9PS95_9APHY|nr:hypothetical protein BD310DRAFT_564230 [Dichomitus squalens]